MSKLVKIAHLTSAHARYDVRIFVKMCTSLAKNSDYQVNLVVADGKGDESKNGVQIVDVGAKSGGRISRMTKTVKKVFLKAKELDCDIYHMHDPELMPIGVKLKKLGKKVIFDAHEDLPKQILSKPYLNGFTKTLLSKTFELYEKFTCKKFDYMITATPYIRDKFLAINPHSVDVNNFPIIEELTNETKWSERKNEACYVGGIAEIRGIKEVILAMQYVKSARLNLVGAFSEKEVKEEVKSYEGWDKVNEIGFLSREEVAEVMSRSKMGIVTFYPVPNHIDAQPNKMFEYMSAGLPLVTSNFPLWREIVEENRCGLCVDPLNPKEISDAVNYIISNPKEAKQMSENGKRAVVEKYNWKNEEKKLFKIYKELSI